MNNTNTSNDVPCFFCRFNLGFTVNNLEPGLMGFLVIISSLFCLSLCIGLAICFCCCRHNNKQYEYLEVPGREQQQPTTTNTNVEAASTKDIASSSSASNKKQ